MGYTSAYTREEFFMAIETGHLQEQAISIDKGQEQEICHTTLNLEGMACASCAMRIEKGLKKVPGVTDVQVNLATKLGNITYDTTQTSIEQLIQKVEDLGYKATPTAQPTLESSPTETSNPPMDGYSSPQTFLVDERSRH